MEYDLNKKEIKSDKILSELDKFVFSFIKILEKYTDYVIISGYVSILLGRTRVTEDVDIFIKELSFEKFSQLYDELKQKGFWCINAEEPEEIYDYLKSKLGVRFSKENESIPNFEVKFPKREVDREAFQDFIIVKLKEGNLKISSLERHIAFKRYYLKTDKDNEDAKHVEDIFKGKIDYDKINKLKRIVEKIKD
ncbi:MAG: hypothetical protein AABW67_03820 [Nanoarchaeota archaeon]